MNFYYDCNHLSIFLFSELPIVLVDYLSFKINDMDHKLFLIDIYKMFFLLCV